LRVATARESRACAALLALPFFSLLLFLTIISRLSSMRSSHGDIASGLTPSSGISK